MSTQQEKLKIVVREPTMIDADSPQEVALLAVADLGYALTVLAAYSRHVEGAVLNGAMQDALDSPIAIGTSGTPSPSDPHTYAQGTRELSLAQRSAGAIETALKLAQQLADELKLPLAER